MDPAAIRAFVQRSRSLVENEKRAYWAREHSEHSYLRTLAASEALYEHVRRIRPDFPTERDRAEDLAHHIALKRLLDRTALVFSVR